VVLQIIKSLIKLIGLIAVVYILLTVLKGAHGKSVKILIFVLIFIFVHDNNTGTEYRPQAAILGYLGLKTRQDFTKLSLIPTKFLLICVVLIQNSSCEATGLLVL